MSDTAVMTPTSVPTPNTAPVIQVQGVYKEYRQYTYRMSLRHEAKTVITKVLGQYLQRAKPEPFYALQNVSFDVYKGESVAIVGHNGAGKTTLLRLLSGITTPSRGEIKVNGRFATLIGLGAGFNPEMSGRENIYLNAAFFGWEPDQTREIESEIIKFSEIENFIDTPVKVYSSGMVARLGFSIAVHTLPEIVFLDEVLGVGDAAFAIKSSNRIRELREEGRTIITVSHSPNALREMCTRALWMDHGQLREDGDVETVLAHYQESVGA